jgi:hypothetical protein
MKTKRLGNTSEFKTRKILEKALAGTGFYICQELPLNKVLDCDGEILKRQERETLKHSSFDFVIFNNESQPEFAVEFDGPHHCVDEKQQLSDARKNSLCSKARLPLLRLDDEFLSEYEKTSLLEYVIRRFVAWRNDAAEVSQEEADIADHLAKRGAGEEEYEQMRDPQIMWDLFHPFPASTEIAEAVFSNQKIVSSWIDAEVYCQALTRPELLLFEPNGTGSHPVGLDHYREERTYELRRITQLASGKSESQHLHSISVGVTYQFKLPTTDRRRFYSGESRILIEDAHGQDLLGISMSELAHHFCDFLALNKLKQWIAQGSMARLTDETVH